MTFHTILWQALKRGGERERERDERNKCIIYGVQNTETIVFFFLFVFFGLFNFESVDVIKAKGDKPDQLNKKN